MEPLLKFLSSFVPEKHESRSSFHAAVLGSPRTSQENVLPVRRTVLCREVLSHKLHELHPWHPVRRRNSSTSSERLGNTSLCRGAAIRVLFSHHTVTILASGL